MRSQKGITLVALVVTIIVLLILAGVTMALVLGNDGIFGKANTAKDETAKSDFLSSVKLSMLNIKVNAYGNEAVAYPTTLKDMLDAIVVDLHKGDYTNAAVVDETAGTIKNGESTEVIVTIEKDQTSGNFNASIK